MTERSRANDAPAWASPSRGSGVRGIVSTVPRDSSIVTDRFDSCRNVRRRAITDGLRKMADSARRSARRRRPAAAQIDA
ncbi:hypothetical protein C6P79_05975 [Burkholderia multivorans]|nr:hypothetical protein C6P79_05975 [Burkholderia multivorans]